MFTCKFHGWSYALDGKLAFVPDEERFFGLKKETLGMTPVAVDVWAGFIFINVDPNPQETLRDYLGELGAGLIDYPFGELSATSTSWTTEVKANWKVIKDAFQEVYHVAFLHKRSIPDLCSRLILCHCLVCNCIRQAACRYKRGFKPTRLRNWPSARRLVIRRTSSHCRRCEPTRSKNGHCLNVIFPAFFVDV
jgi:hypothetical protein